MLKHKGGSAEEGSSELIRGFTLLGRFDKQGTRRACAVKAGYESGCFLKRGLPFSSALPGNCVRACTVRARLRRVRYHHPRKTTLRRSHLDPLPMKGSKADNNQLLCTVV